MFHDHCRIGSLEIVEWALGRNIHDHCRIGSLEMFKAEIGIVVDRSLPHRQLRNGTELVIRAKAGSLPHRQLRKN